jgi:hypothetical protein
MRGATGPAQSLNKRIAAGAFDEALLYEEEGDLCKPPSSRTESMENYGVAIGAGAAGAAGAGAFFIMWWW